MANLSIIKILKLEHKPDVDGRREFVEENLV